MKKTTNRPPDQKIAVRRGSGNVFADLELPDAEEYLAKAKLAAQIALLIERRGLTQTAAGRLLRLPQPKVSARLNGLLDGFSTDRLLRFLNNLGCDIRITVSPPHPRSPGRVQVIAG
jgi:predicted XRE-type DNA-binding protein